MPKPANPRNGKPVKIKGRELQFSYWPMYRTTRRYGLQATLYATNPWAIVRSAVTDYCRSGSRPEALAYVLQSQFFYDAASNTEEWAAKPLLLYYCFMNIAKAFILTAGVATTLDQAQHGVSEKLRPLATPKELSDAFLEVHPSPGPRGPNVFADFWRALTGHNVAGKIQLDLPVLLPQLLAGHRLWCEATGSHERFMSVRQIRIMQNSTAKSLWILLSLNSGTLSQRGLSHAELLKGAGLNAQFKEVTSEYDGGLDELVLRFEQTTPELYSHRPSDAIPQLVRHFRQALWATVTTARPFREYYLYVAPIAERSQVLPQLLSLYAVVYYLGSIARYRPQHFDSIIAGRYGPYLQEFLTSQPNQFLYLLASEFARREITRPALV